MLVYFPLTLLFKHKQAGCSYKTLDNLFCYLYLEVCPFPRVLRIFYSSRTFVLLQKYCLHIDRASDAVKHGVVFSKINSKSGKKCNLLSQCPGSTAGHKRKKFYETPRRGGSLLALRNKL